MDWNVLGETSSASEPTEGACSAMQTPRMPFIDPFGGLEAGYDVHLRLIGKRDISDN